MANVYIWLSDEERRQLLRLARRELRSPRDQARLILRRALARAARVTQAELPASEEPEP